MEDNREIVEESTENVEAQTTEEIEDAEEPEEVESEEVNEPEEDETSKEEAEKKLYTDEELDEIIARKLSRQKRKLEREYEKKYSRLETVVNAGLGTSDIEEATNKLTEFYEENGVNIPNTTRYSEEDIKLLANAEADDFIKNSTYKELVEEVDELASIPREQLTERDKIVFLKLADERKKREEESAVLQLGISKEDLESKEYKDFSSKLNPELSIKEKYEMYLKLKPKKETKKMGSMKSGAQSNVKDYYSPEEISKLTEEELDDPAVWESVRKSMTKGANIDNIF